MVVVDIYLALFLVLIGFTVGILSGFFGFGGGFIITPFLFIFGVPMNIAVGTSIAQILGTSVIATMRHRTLKHIDVKLGIIIALGSIFGVEAGAQLVEYFKGISVEALNLSINLTYIFVLGFVSIYVSHEAWKSSRSPSRSSRKGIAEKVQSIKFPPMISLSRSNVDSISFWIVLFVGFITSVLAGFIGAGGGFVQMPSLIYIIGCETAVAVGTNLFGMLIAGVYACFSHAFKGNVDVLLAVYMLAGSAVGAQIGASATKYVKGEKLRLAFGFCVGLVSLSVVFKLMSKLLEIQLFNLLSQAVLVLTVTSLVLLVMKQTFQGMKNSKKSAKKKT